MAEGIESFSEMRNLNRVTAGLKEAGPFYNSPNTPKPMNFEDGYPAVYNAKVDQGKPVSPMVGPIQDVWNDRRSNGTIK